MAPRTAARLVKKAGLRRAIKSFESRQVTKPDDMNESNEQPLSFQDFLHGISLGRLSRWPLQAPSPWRAVANRHSHKNGPSTGRAEAVVRVEVPGATGTISKPYSDQPRSPD
jgi:hypothetical protein